MPTPTLRPLRSAASEADSGRSCATRLIFWDWNGTLLDDAAYAIGVRNRSFPAFGLPTIDSMAEYRAQFTFPVREYYRRAGVTDDIFVPVAHAWMGEYLRGCHALSLFGDAREALGRFAAAGMRQVVLSASKLDTLRYQLFLAGVAHRFDAVLGLTDIYAASKTAIGRRYLTAIDEPPAACVMLGDTLHDAQVASELGCRCVLVARGHQDKQTLLTAGVPVVNSLTAAAELLL